MGIEIRPALQAALHNPDLEVRYRVRHVLETVVQADEVRRWNEFVEDLDGTKHYDFPGWSRFQQVVGRDRAARQLFADMYRAEPDLLKATDEGPAEMSQTLENRIAEEILLRPWQFRGGNSFLGSVSAMLFVGSDKHVTLTESSASQLTMFVFGQTAIRQAMNGGDQTAPVKKVLGAWVSRDTTANQLYLNLWLAMKLNLKEGIGVADGALRQPNQPINVRLMALTLIAKVGDPKDLPAVESCMNDNAQCAIMMMGNEQPIRTQVRDVALAAAVKLQGQDFKSFGFDRLDSVEFPYENPGLLGFRTDEERATAAKKWGAWVAAHPAPADAKSQANKP